MMRTHWSPPNKTPLKENLFSNWPWALSLSLSQWQGEHFFLVESFANKNFFVWTNNYGCNPIHHYMACASHIDYIYVIMCHKNNSITKSWIFSQLFQEYHFPFQKKASKGVPNPKILLFLHIINMNFDLFFSISLCVIKQTIAWNQY